MDVNLFSQVNPSAEECVENDFYGKVLQQRQRPAIPQSHVNEPAPDDDNGPSQDRAGISKFEKPTKLLTIMKKYDHEEVWKRHHIFRR